MNDIAIQVENVGKLYRIGSAADHNKTFREALTDMVAAPFRRIRNAFSPPITKNINQADYVWALKNVTFDVQRGEVIGIIGRNGAGKSTLLKILSRITEPTEGRVRVHGRIGSLLEVGTGFHSELTGEENIYLSGTILGMNSNEISRKFDEIVAFAEVEKYIHTPVKHYSSGMYMRLAFAVAAYLEAEILLIDEILAVGDAQFQKKCLGKMGDVAKTGRTILFVSHNMSAIQYLCDSALLIEGGKIKHYGSASETVMLYEKDILAKGSSGGLPPHVIYDRSFDEKRKPSDFTIVRIEVTDKDGHPKADVSTWDTVIFRIHCWARYRVHTGSVVLQISTPYGVPLLLCSTQPDSAVPMTITQGQTIVECEFSSLPLSAGEYVVGGGLAIPNKEWLYKEDQMGILSVSPKDVYHSGKAPTAARSILATPHIWRVK